MDTFLPTGYEQPETPSNYFRFQDGINRFRILSPAIVGYEYFTADNKPVRSPQPFDSTPNIKDKGKVKLFWAFVVYDYQDKRVKIMEVTQVTIQKAIKALVDNPKWGDPKQYDLNITRTGEGMDTEYQVQAEPPIGEIPSEVAEAYMGMSINLPALYDGKDPFKKD